MFKSRFAREMVQFNSLTEEVLCGGYHSSALIEEEEEEWIDAKEFKHILDLSENLERNIKLWESCPDNQPSPSSTGIRDNEDNQTMTVSELPSDPAVVSGLSVASIIPSDEEGWSHPGIYGDVDTAEGHWESRVFSNSVGGSERRSIAGDVCGGGRRSIGLSIFAGYEEAGGGSAKQLSADNLQANCSAGTGPVTAADPIYRTESCRAGNTHSNNKTEVVRAESCRTADFHRNAESGRPAEAQKKAESGRIADSEKKTEPSRTTDSPRTSEISRVETVLSIGESAWQKSETGLEQLENEVRRLRTENVRLEEELERAREGAARHADLQRELDQLRWQISKMEDSRRVYETATNQLVTFLDLVSDQLSGSSPSRAKSALDLVSLAGTESRLSLAPSTHRLDFLGLDAGRLSLGGPTDLSGKSVSSRASLGSDLCASRAAAIASANIRLSLGGGYPAGGSSLELNNRMRRHYGAGGTRSGRGIPRMGVEGASLYSATAAASNTSQNGGNNIWRSRSEVGFPGFTTAEQKRAGRSYQRRSPRSDSETTGAQETRPSLPAHQYSQDCAASLESKDSGRSTDSGSSGRSSPKDGAITKDRQQLAGRARRLVRAVRQLLTREKSARKSSYTPPTPAGESPWLLKPQPSTMATSGTMSTLPSSSPSSVATEDEASASSKQAEQYNKVIISINPRPSIRAESDLKKPSTGARKNGTPRKSFSFTHSTPRRELKPHDDNLIKITKMGTVSVPVPYPITPLKGSQTWF